MRRYFLIIATLFAMQFSTSVQAQVEISINNKNVVDKFFRLQPVNQTEYPIKGFGNYWKFGRWQLDEMHYLESGYGCFLDISYGFWPTPGKCFGSFDVYIDKLKFKEKQDKELSDLAAKHQKLNLESNRFQRLLQVNENIFELKTLQDIHSAQLNNFERSGWDLSVKYKGDLSEIFEKVRGGGYLLSIDGKSCEIEKFQELTQNGIKLAVDELNDEVKNRRREIVFTIAIAVLGVLVSLFVFVKLVLFLRKRFSQAKEKAQQLKDAAADQIDKLQAANQRRKVRSVVVDETIREMTRTALSATDDKSKEILIAELRKAIESGNHELANALEIALKKA